MTAPNISLMLVGDVMIGRGIDQVLPHPGSPSLFEPYLTSALDYVRIAERANGPIDRPVPFDYVWGDGLEVLARHKPDVRIVNLETAVTRANQPWPKGINYRMDPDNVPCLAAANIDCCVIANNHIMDWGRDGLVETLRTLHRAGIKTAGAGQDLAEAAEPAILPLAAGGRVLVYAFASPSSGVPEDWAATTNESGVNLLVETAEAAAPIAARISRDKRRGDIVICSVHWGGNWGYKIPAAQRDFAHALVDTGEVNIIHGHSSHHPKAIEVYHGRPILYGCGDLLNDYEGIEGHNHYRGDLALMYLLEISRDGALESLDMIPFRVRKFRLDRTDSEETEWLRRTMDRECMRFGGHVRLDDGDNLTLLWSGHSAA